MDYLWFYNKKCKEDNIKMILRYQFLNSPRSPKILGLALMENKPIKNEQTIIIYTMHHIDQIIVKQHYYCCKIWQHFKKEVKEVKRDDNLCCLYPVKKFCPIIRFFPLLSCTLTIYDIHHSCRTFHSKMILFLPFE